MAFSQGKMNFNSVTIKIFFFRQDYFVNLPHAHTCVSASTELLGLDLQLQSFRSMPAVFIVSKDTLSIN